MIKLSYITLFFLLTALLACRKDKVPLLIEENLTDTCDCKPIPFIEGYNWGYNHIPDSVYLTFPRFNPNNDEEIIFCEEGENGQKILYYYDLVTKSRATLFEGTILGTPQWGKSNWIIFTQGYNGVYKIRPDGSELSLLISGGTQFHPTFNHEGNRILTFHGFTQGGFYPLKIWNLEGELVDSLNYKFGSFAAWEQQDNIAVNVEDSVLIIDPDDKEVLAKHHAKFGGKSYGSVFVWINENEAIIENEGLQKLNVWTGQLEKIACSCSSLLYYFGNTNFSGTKVIFNKIVSKNIDEVNLLVTSSIVIFDVATNTFEEVEIL